MPFRAIAFEAIESASCSTRACVEEGTEVRSRAEVTVVLELVEAGWNDCQIARETGIPRRTIRDWRRGRTPDFERVRTFLGFNARSCVVCGGDPLNLPLPAYTYLLGLYLGDGYIAAHARGVCFD
jgi:Homeodomain-like domain